MLKIRGGLDSPANVARKGKVRVFSSAETQFTGEKIVHWKHGRVVAEPAQLTAATQAHLRGVSAPILQRFRRLHGAIKNFAWKKAHQTRTQAECESARLAEQQVGAEIDRQVESKIEQINQKLNEHLLTPLDRLGVGVQDQFGLWRHACGRWTTSSRRRSDAGALRDRRAIRPWMARSRFRCMNR